MRISYLIVYEFGFPNIFNYNPSCIHLINYTSLIFFVELFNSMCKEINKGAVVINALLT